MEDSDGNYIDLDDGINFENIAWFLFRHEYKWIFCYNLRYDGDVMSKLFGKILNSYNRSGRLVFDYNNRKTGTKYKIKYIENKSFTISRGHHSVTVYDIAQFCERKSLLNAYTKTFPNRKLAIDYLEMKKKRSLYIKIL